MSTVLSKLSNKNQVMTPQEIVNELNRYIIGQDEAKRAVAIVGVACNLSLICGLRLRQRTF